MCFLFFKQKTAYEMRISDWSSDVCSSDLRPYQHAYHHPIIMKNGNRIEGLWERKVGIEKAESTLRLARHIRLKQIDAVPPLSAKTSTLCGSQASSKIGRASCRERVCQYV